MKTEAIVLVHTPNGLPQTEDFEIVSTEIGAPSPGEVLVENLYLSVDPYLRAILRSPNRVGQIVPGLAVGRVMDSRSDSFPVGTYVTGELGWSRHVVCDPTQCRAFRPDGFPLSAYLGELGMPGLTAWAGLLQVAKIAPGEVVYVSAASGAVGSLAGQIAREIGCTVIGSSGNDDNVRRLTQQTGFHYAFNYRSTQPLLALRDLVPDGIDVYFENVGGPQLEAAIEHMRPWGRIALCGMISTYNDTAETISAGPRNLARMIYKRITMRGFLATDFYHMEDQFLSQMKAWLKNGSVKADHTIESGIESVPSTFIRLFNGTHSGKLVIELCK